MYDGSLAELGSASCVGHPYSLAMPVGSRIQPNSYFDSVVLMRIASDLLTRPGVSNASLVMATEANKAVLAVADLLSPDAKGAGPNDLVIAVDAAADELAPTLDAAVTALTAPRATATPTAGRRQPRTLVEAAPGSNLALISTPGAYAGAEAMKALRLGMHVFVFSDNVPLSEEVELKAEAGRRGLLVMGPDCGTTIINGVPLGFANDVRSGVVGLIGASGTGLQEVSCLLDRWDCGVSQVIGVGSRDLSEEVRAASLLSALDALLEDPATEVIVLLSKPPAASVVAEVVAKAAAATKPVVVAFLGATDVEASGAVEVVDTLDAAAQAAYRLATGQSAPPTDQPDARTLAATLDGSRTLLRAVYTGGTFAYETDLLMGSGLGPVARSLPGFVSGRGVQLPDEHVILDLGDDEFTVGRPHPMIDPTVRTEVLRGALSDPRTAVVLLDVVLGYGAATDPAEAVASALAEAPGGPVVLAFIVGTETDPQGRSSQEQQLTQAGAIVVGSSTVAARLARNILELAAGEDA